jgi:ATP-dependent Clp protease ATP-binding subunit ClpB
MTSNVGSHLIKQMAGQPYDEVRHAVMAELDRTFRPEFLNRIDDTILFHSLSKEDLRQIVEIQLGHLKHLLAERGISIELSDAAKDFLAEEGYDPVFGARPLKRVIQRELQDELALAILEGRIMEGDHVRVEVGERGLVFESEVEGEPVLS